eukprot:TRINITY_DN2444_c0_g1_i5.p1 TRINITY_DN2444_c0_g1~~TRINITY_DN2444_c0_g1_i5.p1  ORF type:complete len:145 (-),score=26.14 TRINITY_DN2444_c0_g1_i5:72-479(-)
MGVVVVVVCVVDRRHHRTNGTCCCGCRYHLVSDPFMTANVGSPYDTKFSCCLGCDALMYAYCCVGPCVNLCWEACRWAGNMEVTSQWENLGCWGKFCYLMSCGNAFYQCHLAGVGGTDIHCYCCERVLFLEINED